MTHIFFCSPRMKMIKKSEPVRRSLRISGKKVEDSNLPIYDASTENPVRVSIVSHIYTDPQKGVRGPECALPLLAPSTRHIIDVQHQPTRIVRGVNSVIHRIVQTF